MEIVSLNCNSCGAALEVEAGTNYVTCTHCGARLAVKRTGNSAYTEILEKLDQKTDAIAEQLEEIARQNEIERIDREWEQERFGYMVRGKHGHRHVPSEAMGLLTGGVGAGFGLIWLVFVGSMGAPPLFLVFGVFFIVVAIASGIWVAGKGRQYREAEARYRRRRSEMLRGDRDADSGPPFA